MSGFTKYSFGTYGVFVKDDDFDIRGVWLWRGTEIPNEIKELPNYEYHFWTKLDLNKPEDLTKLKLYWTTFEEGKEVEGWKVSSVKYLKWFWIRYLNNNNDNNNFYYNSNDKKIYMSIERYAKK